MNSDGLGVQDENKIASSCAPPLHATRAEMASPSPTAERLNSPPPGSLIANFMTKNKMQMYTDTLLENGFEDMEDLPALCRDKKLLATIMPLPGHQAKFQRIVNEYAERQLIAANGKERTHRDPFFEGGESESLSSHNALGVTPSDASIFSGELLANRRDGLEIEGTANTSTHHSGPRERLLFEDASPVSSVADDRYASGNDFGEITGAALSPSEESDERQTLSLEAESQKADLGQLPRNSANDGKSDETLLGHGLIGNGISYASVTAARAIGPNGNTPGRIPQQQRLAARHRGGGGAAIRSNSAQHFLLQSYGSPPPPSSSSLSSVVASPVSNRRDDYVSAMPSTPVQQKIANSVGNFHRITSPTAPNNLARANSFAASPLATGHTSPYFSAANHQQQGANGQQPSQHNVILSKPPTKSSSFFPRERDLYVSSRDNEWGTSKRIVVRRYVDLKVVVLGQGGVGKTALIHRLVNQTFNNRLKCTIGVDFSSKTVQITRFFTTPKREGIIQQKEYEIITDVNLQFWDIAGQEDCGNATRTYYHNAKAAIIAYDATDAYSLTTAIRWKKDLEAKVKFNNGILNIPTILVANKIDAISYVLPLKRKIRSAAIPYPTNGEGHGGGGGTRMSAATGNSSRIHTNNNSLAQLYSLADRTAGVSSGAVALGGAGAGTACNTAAGFGRRHSYSSVVSSSAGHTGSAAGEKSATSAIVRTTSYGNSCLTSSTINGNSKRFPTSTSFEEGTNGAGGGGGGSSSASPPFSPTGTCAVTSGGQGTVPNESINNSDYFCHTTPHHQHAHHGQLHHLQQSVVKSTRSSTNTIESRFAPPIEYNETTFTPYTTLEPPETAEDVQNLINAFKFTGHYFVSAKTGARVEEMCDYVVTCILKMDPHGTDEIPPAILGNPDLAASRTPHALALGVGSPSPLRGRIEITQKPTKKKKSENKCSVV